MSEYLPFLVIGLATGSVYAIAAMGLTVTYTTSGVFNFAHGAVGMIATFVFYSLRVDVGLPTWLAMAIAVPGVGPALPLVFRYCRLGMQTRAVVDAPGLTELEGLASGLITPFSWMLGCSFAALAGVLLAPLLGVDAVLLTLLAIQVFGAAVIGRLTSLPLTYFGAMLIGLGQALATKLVTGHQALNGLPTSLPFIILFAVLVLSPKGFFQEVVRTKAAAVR